MSDSDTCHVVVLGFDPQLEPPATRLQRVFGLDQATCEALLENLPATVQRSVPRVRAEYFRRALLSIGAHVEVRTPEGSLVEPPAVAPPAPPLAASPPLPSVAPPTAPSVGEAKTSRPPAAGTDAVPAHAAATEPLPAFQLPSAWGAEPSPWAVDPTSQTMSHAATQSAGLAAQPSAAPGWGTPAPWSPPVGSSEPTAIVGPPAGMPAPVAHAGSAAGWPSAPAPLPQPELRAPAAPTLREAAAPVVPSVAPNAPGGAAFAAQPTAHAVPAPALGPAAPHARAAGPTAFGAGGPFAPGTGRAPGAPAAASGAPSPFGAAQPVAPAAPFAPAAPLFGSPAGTAASGPPGWGASLDLASLRPAANASPGTPFALEAGSAPLPEASAAPGISARLPSDIWDAPVADAPRASGHGDPSGIYDPPAVSRPLVDASAGPAPRISAPPPAADRAGKRPPIHSSAPPPPAALEQAIRNSAPPPPAGAAADGFQVLHDWQQLREELEPGVSRPAPRPAGPAHAAPAAVRPGAAPAARATARSVQGADLRSFWHSFGEAMALPFTGPGPYWIAAITVWSVVVGVIGLLASFMFILGLVVSFCAHTSLVAMACDYYRACFWAPAVGERQLDRAPDFDPARIMGDYVGRGLHLSLFVVASQVAAIAWVAMSLFDGTAPTDLLLDPITWLLFFFPYFYWPMGVALTALRNDFGGIWHVVVGVRAIARAPLEYLAVVLVGFAVLALSTTALFLCGSMLGLTGTILSGTLGLPLALSHGVQGALMGHLTRARADIFEE